MDHPRRRRSSARITLVLIGTASVSGCGDPNPVAMHRDMYQHQSQCVREWSDAKKCEVIANGPNRGYWYGPSYTVQPDGTTNPRRNSVTVARGGTGSAASQSRSSTGSQAVATHSVSRGGFGSTASAHSGGS